MSDIQLRHKTIADCVLLDGGKVDVKCAMLFLVIDGMLSSV